MYSMLLWLGAGQAVLIEHAKFALQTAVTARNAPIASLAFWPMTVKDTLRTRLQTVKNCANRYAGTSELQRLGSW